MPLQQKIMALIISLFILLFVINAVRLRKLKEEFSFFWITISIIIFIISIWQNLLTYISSLLHINIPVLILIFFGLITVILICLQLSIKISTLIDQNKNLAQKTAILEYELKQKKEREKK